MTPDHSGYIRGNSAELIHGGRDYFQLLLQLIDAAEETIHLQTYILDDDDTGNAVTNALISASARGVKVFLLLDGYGSQSLSSEWRKRINDSAIFFRFFKTVFKSRRFYLGRRLHHKVFVADSAKALVGGLNISDRYNDTTEAPAWLDWALFVEGPAARELEQICSSRLRLRKRRVALKHRKQGQAAERDGVMIRVSVNDWVRRKRQIYNGYLQMLQAANSHVIIMSAYFLPGKRFRKRIEEAVRRGVNVKVVLTGNADVFMIKYAERYIYQWLFKNGIEVYEYQKSVLHGKISACDSEWMTVGSFNINNLSAYASVELNLDVLDKKFTRQVEARLHDIIKNDCVRVTKEKFAKQFNLMSRLANHLAYRLFRFLFFLSTKQGGDA